MSKKTSTIKVQSQRDLVRELPGMYIGDADKQGLATIVREIIDNAIDEYPNYTDSTKPIEVTLYADNSVAVRDYGRGISPYESAENPGQIEERLAYTIIGAGGKFQANRLDNNAQFSGGLHGTGAAATNFMSEFFDVTIWTDGRVFHDRFEDGGNPIIKLVKGQLPSEKQKGPLQTGTRIHFKPDPTVMTELVIDSDAIHALLKHASYLTDGLELIFHNERDGETARYKTEQGLIDYVEELAADEDGKRAKFYIEPFSIKGVAEAQIGPQKKDVKMQANIAMAFSSDKSFAVEAFTNGIRNPSGGEHVNGFYNGIIRLIRHYFNEFKSEMVAKHKRKLDMIMKNLKTKNKISDPSEVFMTLQRHQISRYIYVVLDLKHSAPVLQPQTKDKLVSKEAYKAVSDIVFQKGRLELDRNVEAIHTIIGLVIDELHAKAKQDEDKTTLDVVETAKKMSGKYAGVKSRNAKECELFIVEGDSAGGQVKVRRNPWFQGLLPLRGKVLNVVTSTKAEMLANEELASLILALGCGIGNDYDESKLRYDRIIITTDQDTDGLHIQSLLLTFFMRYMPQLVLNGHVYILDTPLFVNELKRPKRINVLVDGKTVYTYTPTQQRQVEKLKPVSISDPSKDQDTFEVYSYSDAEQSQIMRTYGSNVLVVNRNKGLGELEKNQVDSCILDAATRKLTRVMVEDIDAAYGVIDNLMGSNATGRRRLAMEDGA